MASRISFSFLRRSFFARALARTNEVERTNILAPGLRCLAARTFLPPSPPDAPEIGVWEIVSSYSSATAPESSRDFSRRSTDQTRKELREH